MGIHPDKGDKMPYFKVGSKETVDNLPEGSRIYLVQFKDEGGYGGGATALVPEDIKSVDELCAKTNVPFQHGLKEAASINFRRLMWNGEPPEGTKIVAVDELSRRELDDLVRADEEMVARTKEKAN